MIFDHKVVFEDLLSSPIRNGLTKPKAIRGNGVKMIGMKEIFAYDHIRDTDMDLVPTTEKELETSRVAKGDLLFARQSLVLEGAGKCSIVDEVSENTVFESHLIRARVNQEKAIPDYVFYYFNSSHGKENIRTIVEQVAAAGIRGKDLIKLAIPCPTLEVQERIVDILGSFDEKLHLNETISSLLRNKARLLFNSWFVRYEPFDGERPTSWKTVKLKDVLRLKKQNIKPENKGELPYLPIDSIPMNSFAVKEFKPTEEAKSSLITFDEDDILIGAMRVYFHRVLIAPCAGITRTTCFTLEPIDKRYLYFLLLFCDQDSAIEFASATSKGSTMPYAVWQGGLGEMEVTVPSEETITSFNNIVEPIIEQTKNSYFENNQLLQAKRNVLDMIFSDSPISERLLG